MLSAHHALSMYCWSCLGGSAPSLGATRSFLPPECVPVCHYLKLLQGCASISGPRLKSCAQRRRPQRAQPKQTRAAAREERVSAARASQPLRSVRPLGLRRPTQPGGLRRWPSGGWARESSTPTRQDGPEQRRSPDLPAASYSRESIALQKWCLRGAWGVCPTCNILQARPWTSACLEDVPEPLLSLSEAAAAALRLLDFDLGPESCADHGYRKHVRMIRFSCGQPRR